MKKKKKNFVVAPKKKEDPVEMQWEMKENPFVLFDLTEFVHSAGKLFCSIQRNKSFDSTSIERTKNEKKKQNIGQKSHKSRFSICSDNN